MGDVCPVCGNPLEGALPVRCPRCNKILLPSCDGRCARCRMPGNSAARECNKSLRSDV